MRSLVSLRVIDEIHAIPDADKIEVAQVGGWKVIVKKGEFKAGDIGVYHEIDSWLPASNPAYSFLMPQDGTDNKVFDGIEGARLRTKKMRGVVSQGLLLPLSSLIGADLSSCFGVTKWEKYINQSCGSNKPKGNFPFFIPKTDQERCQNLKREIKEWQSQGNSYEITEKLDGSSATFYWNDGQFGVCSRNLELQETEDSLWWKVAKKYGIEIELMELGRNLAIQGEIVAFNVQGNPYKLSQGEFHFYVFDIFDIDAQKYLLSGERHKLTHELSLQHVPIVNSGSQLSDLDALIKFAEGKSELNNSSEREGIVLKNTADSSQSFKAISNKFLLKNED